MHASRTSRRPSAGFPRRPQLRFGLGMLLAAMAAAAAAPFAAAGCSGAGEPNEFTGSTTTGTSTGGGAGNGGSGGSGQGGSIFQDGGIQNNFHVSPQNPIFKVEVPLQGQTLPFQCLDSGTLEPVPGATWEITNLDTGALSDTGVFTPNGLRTGTATVRCKVGEAAATTTLRVVIHASDNQGLTPAQIDVLRGPPGNPDPTWQFMYPYDRTVFPRGILAPEIHLTQGGYEGNAFYVHVVATDFEYEGFFSTSGTNTQLQMSQEAWDALTWAAGGSDVEVRVSKIFNAQKYGPIYRTWKIAPGRLHGVIYYNSYDSQLAGGQGAILRIKGNSPTPEVLLGNCVVCHSVAADGSVAAAAGGTFDLSGGQVNPPPIWSTYDLTPFAALYPDQGSVLVTNATPSYSIPGTGGGSTSALYTKNGTLIPNSGVEAFFAMSPVFSHDGAKLAFTDRYSDPQPSDVLAILDYDAVAQQFSNYDVLATPQPGRHLSWPAFTPDNRFVIYQDGVGDDLVTWGGNTGRIFAVDVQTHQVVYLGQLNGDGYMPAGARDENLNFEPTTSPVPSGGFFWVMFTSRRTYGNKLTGTRDETKRLWVSALSINPQPGEDFSHPAFYIGGQELNAGNSRGFWVTEPCKADGESCSDGTDCCNGGCNATGSPPQFVCGPAMGCSHEFGSCETDSDCCAGELLECINNVCSYVPPPN